MSCDLDFCPDMSGTLEGGNAQDGHRKQDLNLNWLTQTYTAQGYDLHIFQDNLPADAPVALCVGECGESVYGAGVQTVQLMVSNTNDGINALLDRTSNLFQDVFNVASATKVKGVYLIGFGFGAFIVAKLLSDRQFFKENPSSNLFQAAYLISGLYNVKNEEVETIMTPTENINNMSPTSGSIPKNRKPSLIDSLIIDKQSFEDRKNLSFVCDFNNKTPIFGEFFTNDMKKCHKQDHGIHATQKETLINSPVYQNIVAENTTKNIESYKKKKDSLKLDTNLVISNDLEMFKLLSKENEDFNSPVNDDYTHLCPMGIRLYVFAGENDSAAIQKQSRVVYDRISNGCQTGNMHFQIKDKLDMASMGSLFKCEDNFLKRLIRFDIVKNL